MIKYEGKGEETLKKLAKKYGGLKMSGNYFMSVSYNPETDTIEVGQ